MNKFIFDEQYKMEKIACGKELDNYSYRTIIKMLARYNYFIRGLEYQDNRQNIKSFVETMLPNIDINRYASIITKTVQNVKKYPIHNISKINITQGELDLILSFGNIKQEKILFTLLAMAKYNYQMTDGKYGYSIICNYADLFKRARVAIPAKERPVFMQFAIMGGFVDISIHKNDLVLTPLYVNDNDKIILELSESDFNELGYTYCAWRTPNQWRRCNCCNTYFKKYKNSEGKDAQYCKNCKTKENSTQQSNVVIDNYTRIVNGVKCRKCIECEKSGMTTWFEVNKFNGVSTMCPECYKEYRRLRHLQAVKKYDNKQKHLSEA